MSTSTARPVGGLAMDASVVSDLATHLVHRSHSPVRFESGRVHRSGQPYTGADCKTPPECPLPSAEGCQSDADDVRQHQPGEAPGIWVSSSKVEQRTRNPPVLVRFQGDPPKTSVRRLDSKSELAVATRPV